MGCHWSLWFVLLKITLGFSWDDSGDIKLFNGHESLYKCQSCTIPMINLPIYYKQLFFFNVWPEIPRHTSVFLKPRGKQGGNPWSTFWTETKVVHRIHLIICVYEYTLMYYWLQGWMMVMSYHCITMLHSLTTNTQFLQWSIIGYICYETTQPTEGTKIYFNITSFQKCCHFLNQN